MHQIESSTSGLLFFGTPHSGSDFAPFAKAVARALNLTGKRINTDILDVLKRDSQTLLDVEDWFGHWRRRRMQTQVPLDITCFFEERELPVVGKVVPEHSSKIQGYSAYGINQNHMVRSNCRFGVSHVFIINVYGIGHDQVY